jgi:hypothetical protein
VEELEEEAEEAVAKEEVEEEPYGRKPNRCIFEATGPSLLPCPPPQKRKKRRGERRIRVVWAWMRPRNHHSPGIPVVFTVTAATAIYPTLFYAHKYPPLLSRWSK